MTWISPWTLCRRSRSCRFLLLAAKSAATHIICLYYFCFFLNQQSTHLTHYSIFIASEFHFVVFFFVSFTVFAFNCPLQLMTIDHKMKIGNPVGRTKQNKIFGKEFGAGGVAVGVVFGFYFCMKCFCSGDFILQLYNTRAFAPLDTILINMWIVVFLYCCCFAIVSFFA